MLGLGLAISVGKRILGGVIEALMSTLRGRAEYSENNTDSKAVVKDIDNYELLDKATILLTPTATSNARVHSVKTYTGDELVTNGTFDTDLTDWQISSWWTWNALGAYHPPTNSHKPLYQQTCEVGKTYKISFDLNVLQGSAKVSLGTNTGSTSQVFATDLSTGSYVYYIKAEYEYIIFNRNNASGNNEYYLDNVSVIDVSSDFDFDRASSATRINSDGLVQDMQSITDPELVLNGDFEELSDEEVTNGTFDTDSDWTLGSGWSISDGKVTSIGSNFGEQIKQTILQTNKIYKLSFDIVDYTSGNIALESVYYGVTQTFNGIGSYVAYFTSLSQTEFRLYSQNFVGSIDNVSVQQVDPNDRWSLGTGWSIEDGKASCDGAGALTSQSIIDQNKTYLVSFDVVNYTSGDIRSVFSGDGATYSENINSVGTYTRFVTSSITTGKLQFYPNSSFNGSIDNISVKDITFSTDVDLARINYDSNGDNGHILLEPTSTNLITYSEDFSQWSKEATVTLTPNYGISPDGTQNSTRMQMNADDSLYISTSSGLIASFYVKGTLGETIRLSNGSATTHTLTGNWDRVETYDSGSVSSLISINTYSGATARDIEIWGAQAEALSYATSYIPTHGSTVTRATETLTGSGNSTLINSTEGVLYAEIAGLVDADTSDRVISLSDNSITNRVEMKLSSSGSIQGRFDSASSDITLTETGLTASNFNKIALVWSSGKCALFINGVKEQEDLTFNTFASDVLFDLSFDSAYLGGSSNFYGNCKALAVFDEALEDDELELLTGITNYGSFNELAQANSYTII